MKDKNLLQDQIQSIETTFFPSLFPFSEKKFYNKKPHSLFKSHNASEFRHIWLLQNNLQLRNALTLKSLFNIEKQVNKYQEDPNPNHILEKKVQIHVIFFISKLVFL